MDATSQRRNRRESNPSTLNAAIEALNSAKEGTSVKPAKVIFGSVGVLLAMIRVGFPSVRAGRPLANVNRTRGLRDPDYVEPGLACVNVCRALDRGMNGQQADQFNQSVFEAIEQLTT